MPPVPKASCQTIVPPRPQALQRLDCVVAQQALLLCDELLYTAEIIAKKIIELAQQGERDTVRIEPLSGESSTATAKI